MKSPATLTAAVFPGDNYGDPGLTMDAAPGKIERGKTERAMRTNARGVTLIELVIAVAVVGILLAIAIPGYSDYMLRVHRNEAIRMLLQASMCQERVYAGGGSYDTSQCQPSSEQQRYRITYRSPDTRDGSYVAMATPQGAQLDDPCGSLSLDQNGARGIGASDISAIKCWNGR